MMKEQTTTERKELVHYQNLGGIKSYYCIVYGVTVICINEVLTKDEQRKQYKICSDAIMKNNGKKKLEVFM